MLSHTHIRISVIRVDPFSSIRGDPAFRIGSHQAAIPDNISRQHRRKSPFHPLVSQNGSPQSGCQPLDIKAGIGRRSVKSCRANPDIPWDEQIVGCTNAIKSGRHNEEDLAAAVYYRGISNGTRGESDRAIQDFDQAIKINPNHVGPFYSRGLTYSNKGQWDRAIQDYDEAIKLNPNYVRAISNRGNAQRPSSIPIGKTQVRLLTWSKGPPSARATTALTCLTISSQISSVY